MSVKTTIEPVENLPDYAFKYRNSMGELRRALFGIKPGNAVKVTTAGSLQAAQQRVSYHGKKTGQRFETSKGDGCIYVRRIA